MAGYAAALRVITGYSQIDGQDMAAEALRPKPGSFDGTRDGHCGKAGDEVPAEAQAARILFSCIKNERLG